MGDAAAVKAKVQQYLTDAFRSVSIDRSGDFSLRHESARIFVEVTSKSADAPVIVKLTIPVLFGVNSGPELHEYVAFHADDYFFGHFSLESRDDGSTDLFFSHRLLGDYLDEAELEIAVAWMITTANDVDDELQARFGGTKFHED